MQEAVHGSLKSAFNDYVQRRHEGVLATIIPLRIVFGAALEAETFSK